MPNYGKFGFDWVRIGDMNANGLYDVTYLGNMGTHANNDYTQAFTREASPYTKFKGMINTEFHPMPITVAGFIKPDIRERYITPSLCLYRVPNDRKLADGTTPDPEAGTCLAATLKLFIEVKTQPDELKLEFDNRYFTITGGGGSTVVAENTKPNKSYFTIPQTGVTIVPPQTSANSATPPHTMDIEINCIQEFALEQHIRAIAIKSITTNGVTAKVENLAGRLFVKPNNKAKRKVQKIVLVNVWTSLASNSSFSNGQDTLLKNFLRQGLVDPKIDKENLDVRVNANGRPDNTFSSYIDGSNIIAYYKYDYAFVARDGTKGRENIHKPAHFKDLETYFNEKLNAKFPGKYTNHIKVFYIGSPGGAKKTDNVLQTLYGYSKEQIKTTLLFDGYDANATTAHEICHSMTLDHSFESKDIIPVGQTMTNAPNGKYTIERGKTDNLMDYSHIRMSLMEWQCKIINARAQAEP